MTDFIPDTNIIGYDSNIVGNGSIPVFANINPLTGGIELTAGGSAISLGGGGLTSIFANSNSLPNWALALTKVRAGAAPAKVLVLGDSTTLGSGGTGVPGYQAGTRAVSPPVKLAAKLASALGVKTRADSVIGGGGGSLSNYGTAYDSRFVNSAGITFGGTLNQAFGGSMSTTTNGATISVTPASTWDTAKIWYARSASQGTFNLSIDGGVPISVNANGANALTSVTISAASPGTHTLTFTKTNVSLNHILAWEFWDSTVNDVRIIQGGASGKGMTDYASSAQPWDGLNLVTSLAPDLTIINFAINDWIAGTNTISFSTALAAYITAAKASGDVLLLTGNPSIIAQASLAAQQVYVDLILAQVGANVVAADTWRRFISYEKATALYADTLHPNGYGYDSIVQADLNAIAVS